MLAEMRDWVQDRREQPMDYVFENHKGQAGLKSLSKWRDAGVTWWLESMWGSQQDPKVTEMVRARLQKGPPLVNKM